MLRLEKVAKTYPKDGRRVTALAPIDLTVDAGRFVALQGPSGSGKTTCLLIAGGLLEPDTGSVLLDGCDLRAMTPDRLAAFRSRNVGFVFQQYHLIPYLTVLENILAPEVTNGGGGNRPRALELAAQFGLDRRLQHFPGELSAGEKQRTALARAFLFRPKILLADEITGNLDEANARLVLGHIKDYVKSGGSALLVTHDREIAREADAVEEVPR